MYRGSIVEVEEERENLACIKEDSMPAVVEKKDLVFIPDGAADDLTEELSAVRTKIERLMNRMHHLDSEYTKKMGALREEYLDARSKEIRIVTHLLKISHESCQK